MSVITRLARPADGARVSRLLDTFREEFGHTAQVTVPLPASHEGPLFVFVAERGDDLVGLIAAQQCHSLVRGTRFLLITDIYVAAESRRVGVATEMMNAAAALARRLGCDSLSLIVENANAAALATAARAGFTKHHDLLLTCPL